MEQIIIKDVKIDFTWRNSKSFMFLSLSSHFFNHLMHMNIIFFYLSINIFSPQRYGVKKEKNRKTTVFIMNHQNPAHIVSNSFDSQVTTSLTYPVIFSVYLYFTTVSLEIYIYMTYGQKMFETSFYRIVC